MDLGKSEALAIVGEVQNFEVVGNTVYNNNNIGIDVAGFLIGNTFYSTENGLVKNNTVYKIDTRGDNTNGDGGLLSGMPENQAYEFTRSAADGGGTFINQSAACIYADGAKDLDIIENRVYECNIGISVSGEALQAIGAAVNVEVRGNLVYDGSVTGLKIGGPGGFAGINNCVVTNNRFYTNDLDDALNDEWHDGSGEVWIESGARNCSYTNNYFLSNSLNGSDINNPNDGTRVAFSNTVDTLVNTLSSFSNNRFYYEGVTSSATIDCLWTDGVGSGTSSLKNFEPDCLNLMNGSGNSYSFISKDISTFPFTN